MRGPRRKHNPWPVLTYQILRINLFILGFKYFYFHDKFVWSAFSWIFHSMCPSLIGSKYEYKFYINEILILFFSGISLYTCSESIYLKLRKCISYISSSVLHVWSRDELIRDVLLWTPTHGRAKAGRPARTYIQQLCEDTGCCPEDLPRAMNDREEWRERVRDIRATSALWWWWWYPIYMEYSYNARNEWHLNSQDFQSNCWPTTDKQLLLYIFSFGQQCFKWVLTCNSTIFLLNISFFLTWLFTVSSC